MKQVIKIKFTDFWIDLNPSNNVLYNTLSQVYDLQLSDDPDVVIYSVEGYDHLNYSCTRIFFTGENQTPDFNICDYALGFHHINFGDRYFRLPLYFLYDGCFPKALSKHKDVDQTIREKTEFCNFVYSNKNADPKRETFYYELSKYKPILSGGRHLNNIGGPVENKEDLQRTTKFSIAFENSSTPGYTTEKIVQAFSGKTIPIYWGDPQIAEQFDSRSFINCHDFKDFDAVIEHVKKVDQSEELYREYMATPIDMGEGDMEDRIRQEFLGFIKPIFSALEKGEAGRRNVHYWGAKYEQRLNSLLKKSKSGKDAPTSLTYRVLRKIFSW